MADVIRMNMAGYQDEYGGRYQDEYGGRYQDEYGGLLG